MTKADGVQSRRDRKRLQTRRVIMDAGQQLFAERPMDGVSIDQIVNAADVSKGSFYNHFDDKQQLANAIFELIQGDLEFRIMTANRAVADPAERVARALGVTLHYGFVHPERVQAILSLSERRTVADSPLNAGVAADVKAGLDSGRFNHIGLEEGVLLVLGTFIVTLRHVTGSSTQRPVAELAVRMAEAILRGLGVAFDDAALVARHVADTLSTEDAS